MKGEVITAVFLLLGALDFRVCEKIEFHMFYSQISDCLNTRCVRQIKACTDTHGKALTRTLKGCVAQKCQRIANICFNELLEPVLSQQEFLSPRQSFFATQYKDEIVAVLIDSALHCWVEEDEAKHLECLLNKLLDVAQPLIDAASKYNNHGAPIFCWLTHSLRGLVNCTEHLDEQYWKEMKTIAEREMRLNTQRYNKCITSFYANWNYCKDFADTFLASSSTRKRQYKDFMICSLHKVILSTAKCSLDKV